MTEKKQRPTLRHELKHPLDPMQDFEISTRLRKLFPHDEHACSHGSYRVSSLYFDTPRDQALRQKIDGVNRREKFRLRYYGEDLSFIRLEKKFKINGLCGKRSASISKEEAERLLENDVSFLLSGGHPLLVEFYAKIRGQLLLPKAIVSYEREAFLYPPGNVRITLDRKLYTHNDVHEFFTFGRPRLDMSEGLSLLEVKYDAFLPEVVRLALQLPRCRAQAFSKYAVCRRIG
ncbi:MAG: polyphosphate polymerase domain-containing protein [Peptostreptococcaceae bacterium]|nr:polyphosphate polymerase domain-containing protein [Peptostreptococcaceae bacterium]